VPEKYLTLISPLLTFLPPLLPLRAYTKKPALNAF